MKGFSEPLEELGLQLAWSLWGELGVRGVVRGRHQGWSIDPEPLIVFTARAGDRDPRLRDESLDWCLQNERYISRARLRGVLGRAGPSTQTAFGPYGATLSEHSGRSWPGATEPWLYQPSGRSKLSSLAKPALVHLRLRALFGVGARAEIVHAFVANPQAQMTASDLARVTGYTKRNITEELDRLELAGLFQVAAPSNQFVYRLHDRAGLLDFVGQRPEWFPNWEPMLRLVAALADTTYATSRASHAVQAIEMEKTLASLGRDLGDARVPPPSPERRRMATPDALQRWTLGLMQTLARGEGWPELKR